MKSKTYSWILLIALSLIWGSSFILMKRGLEAFSSDQVAAMRISIAFVTLIPFLIKHYKINLKKYFWGLIWMGVFGNLIPAFLFTASETQISSSLAGMLNALTPLFTVLVGFIWLKNSPSSKQIQYLYLFARTDNYFFHKYYIQNTSIMGDDYDKPSPRNFLHNPYAL